MFQLLVQYLAIWSRENLPFSTQLFTQLGSMLNKP